MADPRRSLLHTKAKNLVPDILQNPSTIAVAILKTGKTPAEELDQEDFLWIKCRAKITLSKIRDQYSEKRDGEVPWTLMYNGRPVELIITVGSLNTTGDNVVAFDAVDGTGSKLSPTPERRDKPTIPLTPKDPNAKIQKGAGASATKSPLGQGKNKIPQRPIKSETKTERPSPSPQPTRIFPNLPRSGRPTSPPAAGSPLPQPKASPRQNRTLSPQPYANHYPHGLPSLPPGSGLPGWDGLVKAEVGRFWQYHADFIERACRASPNIPRELRHLADQHDRHLWACWRGLTEHQRSNYGVAPTPQIEPNPSWDAHRAPTPRNAPSSSPVGQDRTLSPSELKINVEFSEPPLTAKELEDQKQKPLQLSSLLVDATPHILEAAVEASVELLNKIKGPLSNKMPDSPDAEQWITQIEALQKQAVKTRTVIGVVGNTGAGKSSVINAMLDEERLVPTNCMRACTACVTEISYNYQDKPYVAKIEFIGIADWEKELKILFEDLLDNNGNVSKDCSNEDTDAGVAYAKIKAVYPHKTKEDIANSNIKTMLREVSHILDSERNLEETDSLIFYKKLQSFVDSKEKSTGKKDRDGKKEKTEREFWPLIKVVRLYVKAPALSTGAVIVDLPGVHDANAARAAVAEGYMKQCTGLWIVAPINRAVDDKAAKSLLGESFKRQLKMDGGFSSVSFICSKTDDISLTEAQDSLDLDEQMIPSWEEIDRLSAKRKQLNKQLEEMQGTKAIYEEVANDADEEIEVWETLKESVSEGEISYVPPNRSTDKKRKASSKQASSRKKARKDSSDSEDSECKETDDRIEIIDDDEEEDGGSSHSQDSEPLTEGEVSAKLQELKNVKKDTRAQRKEITEQMTAIKKELIATKEAESKIESELSAMCISGRNQYSKGAIQQDFTAGIKELDQEIAAEEDEENFNPDNEVRDYDEVARELPVFCVSSRGYQKLQGRLRKEPHVPGFTSIEETEIPALQAHCEKLTETGRAANCRSFMIKLSQLLNSLSLWASSDGTGANLTAEQKAREARYLKKGFDGLERDLDNAVKTVCRELKDELNDSIFEKYETAISNASGDSIETALKWGSPVNREDRAAGGLHWSSYKAVCRRNGVFTNSQGLHDWNAQLTEPMIKVIAPGWEKVFTRRVQIVLNNFTRTAPAGLKSFHRDIDGRARRIGASIAGRSLLSQQTTVYEDILKDLATSTKDKIVAKQKDINREFVPVIERHMFDAYDWCQQEVGSGQFTRMRSRMNSHVAQHRLTMFQESADEVRRQLQVLVAEVEEELSDKIDEVFFQVKRDYRSALGGGDQPKEGEILPKLQRQVRKETMRSIESVEKIMRRVVGLEVDESEDEAASEEGDSHEKVKLLGVRSEHEELGEHQEHEKDEKGQEHEKLEDHKEHKEDEEDEEASEAAESWQSAASERASSTESTQEDSD